MYHENLTSQLKTLRQWLEAIKAEGFAYAGIEALLGTLDALIQLPGDDGLTHEDFKDLFSRLKSLYYELWLQGRTEDAKAAVRPPSGSQARRAPSRRGSRRGSANARARTEAASL